jgi:TonB-linked SusC/RagA family outer membrane protein
VIIITTKRGSKDGHINYDSYVSLNSMARKADVLNSAQWLHIEEESYKNAAKFDPTGFAAGKYEDPLEKRKRYLVGNTAGKAELFKLDAAGVAQPLYDVDWQDEVTRNAISQGHNLSWSGGDEKSNYGLFLGYANDNGVIKNTYMQRYSVRAVVDRQVKSWLKAGGTISYATSKEKRADDQQGANNVTRQMIEMVPFIPYKYANGKYGYRGDYEGLENGDNPLAQLYESIRMYNTNTFSGNAYANIRFAKELEFVSTIGANVRNQTIPYFNSKESDLNLGRGRNYAQISSDESRFWQWTNRLNYTHTFKEKHHLNVLAGIEYQKYNRLYFQATTQDMPDDFYDWNNLSAGSSPQAPSSSANAWQMASYFARANYNFNDKYLLTVTGRFDGSSRFGIDNKYAFFPSAALAWRVSQEDFLKNNDRISNLKLRASYGLTGNSEIGEYRSQANLGTNSYMFNGSLAAGTVISTLANPGLKWEKTTQLDFGADLGLFNDRITLEADYFQKKTKDLLLAAPVPASSGYNTMTRNIGSLKNTGIELNINTVNIDRNNFSWRTGLNFAWLKNRITALGVNNEDIYMRPDFLGLTNVLRVGQSVSSFYGYVNDGVWSTKEEAEAAKFGKKPGDIKYRDLKPDGQINSDDRTILGKGIPDFYGTFTNSIRYRNFDLSLELQYSYGNDVFKLSEHSSEDRVGRANSFATVLNAWTPEHQNTEIAQWRPASAGYESRLESKKVEDGSFIRGKNLMLGYTFSKKALSRVGLGSLRMYFSAQNLFIITKYSGYDPEVVTYDDVFAQGILFHDYPKARTFLFGLNVSL